VTAAVLIPNAGRSGAYPDDPSRSGVLGFKSNLKAGGGGAYVWHILSRNRNRCGPQTIYGSRGLACRDHQQTPTPGPRRSTSYAPKTGCDQAGAVWCNLYDKVSSMRYYRKGVSKGIFLRLKMTCGCRNLGQKNGFCPFWKVDT
jgi:hypothetical protein